MSKRQISLICLCGGSLLVILALGFLPECLVLMGSESARYRGKPASYWARKLDDPDAKVRQGAVYALGQLGQDARDQVPKLIAALEDPDNTVRLLATRALAGAPASTDAAAAIVGVLSDADPAVRMAAAESLAKVAAANALRKLEFIGWLHKASQALAGALADPSAAVREKAADALGVIGPCTAVAELTGLLEDSQPSVRASAAKALGRAGPDAQKAAPALLALIGDDDPSVVREAVTALGRIGPQARDAGSDPVPYILECLQDRNRSVAAAAEEALAAIVPAFQLTPETLAQVLEMARSDDDVDRRLALEALRRCSQPAVRGEVASAFVEVYVNALHAENRDVRVEGARVIGELALDREDVREAVRQAVPSLVEVLGDPEPIVRHWVLAALARIGPGASGAVPGIRIALRDEAAFVRQWALIALRNIGPGASEASADVLELLTDTDGEVRAAAAAAMGSLARDPELAVPALVEALSDGNANVRTGAAISLARLGKAQAAVRCLVAMLGDTEPRIRICAAGALGEIGPEAREAAAALSALLRSDNPFERDTAARAIERIESSSSHDGASIPR